MTPFVAPKFGSRLMMAIDKQNNRHTISPQTHIVFTMPRSKKGFGRCNKSGTWNNQGRRRTTPCDNRGFNCNECHSKSNELSLLVISVSLPLNNSVINPPQLSSVCKQSSRSSYNIPCDNQCLNSNHSNSLLFELMWLLSKHLSSRGLLGEDLDDCLQTEDSWGGLMTELFNGR